MLFLDVFANQGSGRVTSDGGTKATKADKRRDDNLRKGNAAMKDAFGMMERDQNRRAGRGGRKRDKNSRK
jgi:hypothetical protein